MTKEEFNKAVSEAQACHTKGDHARELALWEQVAQHQPGHPMWKHNVALALMNNGRFLEALCIFDDLAEHFPDLSRVHNNRAVLLLRLGFDLQFLAPAFSLALETSRSPQEFSIHFHNQCSAIAYGLEGGAQEALSALENSFLQPLSLITPPDLLRKNEEHFKGIISAFRQIALFRDAFSRKHWVVADQHLNAARLKFRELGMENYDRSLDYPAKCLKLCQETIGALEELTVDSTLTPDALLRRFTSMFQEARALCRPDRAGFLDRLVETLGCFLYGCNRALEYLAAPQHPYASDNEPQQQIHQFASTSFTEIGQDLVSFLQFLDRECHALAEAKNRVASPQLLLNMRDAAWKRAALFAKGLVLNFAGIDAALANDALGWKADPLDEAKLEVQRFKLFIERQAYKDVFVDGNPQENIARSLLQAFLISRSYREVPVRGGRTDVLSFSKNGKFLYETKIWRGPDYYQQGLRELEEYIIGEGDDPELKGVLYLNFDPTKSNAAEQFIGKTMSTHLIAGRTVDVFIISLSPPQPSSKRA
jgi:tetratricopeptide (TPR) repeat protein